MLKKYFVSFDFRQKLMQFDSMT